MIAQVSPYTVSDSLPFTTTLFTFYQGVAAIKLAAEDPGLPTAMYDYCHALLIVHYYEVKRGATNVKAKSFGNASVTKGSEKSNYLVEYEQIIASYGKAAVAAALTGGVERCDSTMEELRLDEGDVPSYEDDP